MARATRSAGTGAAARRIVIPVMKRLQIAAKRRARLKPVADIKTPPPRGSYQRRIFIDPKKYPESAKHIRDAQRAGYPRVLTKSADKAKSDRRRGFSLFRVKTKPGKDRDEYPFAATKEGGFGASVRHIDASDNRGAGGSLPSLWGGLPDGAKVWVDTYRRAGDP
jgi:hypothetical protein